MDADGENSGKTGSSPLAESGEGGLLFAICFRGPRSFFAAFDGAFADDGTVEETRTRENVIRSDGYCRIELLGSYSGGAGKEDQPPVV
jgi:hypothetical protein